MPDIRCLRPMPPCLSLCQSQKSQDMLFDRLALFLNAGVSRFARRGSCAFSSVHRAAALYEDSLRLFSISCFLPPVGTVPCFNLRRANCPARKPSFRTGPSPYLSFPLPSRSVVQNKAHSPYWSALPIAPANPNSYNLFHPEMRLFLSGTVH